MSEESPNTGLVMPRKRSLSSGRRVAGNTRLGNPRGANRDVSAGNSREVRSSARVPRISLHGDMKGATAKSLLRCKVASPVQPLSGGSSG